MPGTTPRRRGRRGPPRPERARGPRPVHGGARVRAALGAGRDGRRGGARPVIGPSPRGRGGHRRREVVRLPRARCCTGRPGTRRPSRSPPARSRSRSSSSARTSRCSPSACPSTVSYALVKGRGNYLCLRRMGQALGEKATLFDEDDGPPRAGGDPGLERDDRRGQRAGPPVPAAAGRVGAGPGRAGQLQGARVPALLEVPLPAHPGGAPTRSAAWCSTTTS